MFGKKVYLSDEAVRELREIGEELDMTPSEVLRKGLGIMRVIADAKKEDKDSKLMLGQSNKARELKF